MIRRLLAGFGLSGVIIVVTLIAQILLVPILLTQWGDVVYGEWLTLTNLASSLSIMNLGVQSYVCNLLISSYVKNETEKGTQLLQSALLLYIPFAGISLLAVIAFGFSPALLSWMKVNQIPGLHGHLILVVYGSLATYSIFGGLLLSLFQVTRQMPRQLAYGLLERVIILYSPMLVVLFGGQPLHAAITTVVLFCVLIIFEMRDVWRRSPFSIGLSKANWRLSRSFIKPGLTFFAVSLAALMVSTGITLILANQAGGQAVALFATTLLMVNFVRTLVNQGMNVLWPEITGAAALQDDPARLSRWYLLILKTVSAFMLACAVGISLLGRDVLNFWTRGEISVDPLLILLLAIYLAVHAPVLVSSVFGLSLNRQADLLKVQLTASVITLGLGGIFVATYSVKGAAMALIFGQVIIVFWMLRLACRWVGASWSDFSSVTFPRLLVGFLLFLLISIVISTTSMGLFGRIISSFGLVIFIVVMFWQYWLIAAEKDLLRSKVAFVRVR